jgi:sensor histidine kinase YesM
VVNFSYLLAIRQQDFSSLDTSEELSSHEGIMHISNDGYGYLICDTHPDTDKFAATDSIPQNTLDSLPPRHDSIYVSWRSISRLSLKDGSRMSILARTSRFEGGNKVLAFIEQIDGEPFDHAAAYNRPGDGLLFGIQGFYYVMLAFILLSIMTVGASRSTSVKFYLKRAGLGIVTAAVLFMLMPVMKFRADDIIPNFMNTWDGGMIFDHFAALKYAFVLISVLLYARTYQLIYQKEDVILENERLKTENLKARYNTLINQINPHFLFNSLNSLSALVREGKNDDAVTYIDRLSDTFRYTIQNEPHTTTTLHDELEFVAAYKFLLEVRYDEKLFIDIDVEKDKSEWTLPTFSIQPLIENAVKHNTITRAKPLRITIRTVGDYIEVSNPINPKIEPEKSTGIGLENLSKRWMLLTGKSIEISNDGVTFSVRLPFVNNTAQ